MTYLKAKIKNVYSEKFGKHKLPLAEEFIPNIKGYDCSGGFIMENGTDNINGENKSYLVIKVYMEEKNV